MLGKPGGVLGMRGLGCVGDERPGGVLGMRGLGDERPGGVLGMRGLGVCWDSGNERPGDVLVALAAQWYIGCGLSHVGTCREPFGCVS